MLNEILARRVLIVLGKGGVGKSTLSAALAKVATLSDSRALIMECDARAPLAATFGVKPSFTPTQVAHNLDLMTLDGRAALEEYLRLVVPGRMLLKAVFSSRIYQFFVQAAPGLRELMMLGKIFYDAGRTDAKLPGRRIIIVDAPASGQAMSLLKMPTAALSTFGDSVVGKEARNISRMLRDRRNCAIVQVTTADSLSISETIETHAELSKLHLAPAAVLFNRMPPSEFSADDITALTNRRAPTLAQERSRSSRRAGKVGANPRRRSAQSARKNPQRDRRPSPRNPRAQRPLWNQSDRSPRRRTRPLSRKRIRPRAAHRH